LLSSFIVGTNLTRTPHLSLFTSYTLNSSKFILLIRNLKNCSLIVYEHVCIVIIVLAIRREDKKLNYIVHLACILPELVNYVSGTISLLIKFCCYWSALKKGEESRKFPELA